MDGMQSELNWLATIVGALAAFLFGWLVYSPGVLGRKWAEGSGVDLGAASEMPVFAMASQFLALLALAFVIGLTATQNMLFTAILAVIAVALFAVSGGAFVKKSQAAQAIDGFYVVGSGAIMILVQGLL